MNWTMIEVHKDKLFTIVDAAIPNKAQNMAVKKQIETEINDLMNHIASGCLELVKAAETLPAPSVPLTYAGSPGQIFFTQGRAIEA